MPPRGEKSQLKRPRVRLFAVPPSAVEEQTAYQPQGSIPEDETENKKVRRSTRNAKATDADKTPVTNKNHLPSPVTYPQSSDNGSSKEATPSRQQEQRASIATPRKAEGHNEMSQALGSPPQDTQPMTQALDPAAVASAAEEEEEEISEGVWGYLVPLDPKYGDQPITLKRRSACPLPCKVEEAAIEREVAKTSNKAPKVRDEEAYEKSKINDAPSGGYLIGRHPECDIVVNNHIVSNRHCLLFTENKGTDTVAILEDLSQNGTFVNEAFVGRNQRRELDQGDEIAVHGSARFVFKYPHSRQTSAFLQQYTLLQKLGKGHFAEVYLCVEKKSGRRYAVKVFTKHPGMEDRSKTEGLQQEIGVLMGVSHPNVLCLKDTFNERDRVYLVLELAAEGELFNFIVMKQKLSENEARKLFIQLFQGIKYLVSIPTHLEAMRLLTLPSMRGTLFIGTSSPRTSCSPTKTFPSN